jgi:hypothetical protein
MLLHALSTKEDSISRSTSTPHIFLDSDSSSSIPDMNMFLSYANNDSSRILEGASVSLSSHRGPKDRRRDSSTPHIFLPYAERSDEIDAHCQRYVEEMKLPAFQASVVARAIRIASHETGTSMDAKYRRSLHASFVDKALKDNLEVFEEVDLDDDDTPDLLEEADKDSSWEIDFLRDQVKRQADELEFLRAALKKLALLPLRNQEKTVQIRKESRNPRNSEVPLSQKEDIRVVVGRLPSIIEFPTRESDDDYSELMSELQSPSVIVLANRANNGKPPRSSHRIPVNKPESNPEDSNPVTSLVLQDNSEPQLSFPVCIPSQSIDMPKHGDPSYVKTMQLVFESRTKQRKPSYTEMVVGEIQETRARGMKFQLHFESRGVFVEGVYSGTLKEGLPHGNGVLRFINRDLYIGEFLSGMMHGEGTLLSRCESQLVTLRGTFCKNEFVQQTSNGNSRSSNATEISAGAA